MSGLRILKKKNKKNIKSPPTNHMDLEFSLMYFNGLLSLFVLYTQGPSQEHVDFNTERDLVGENSRALCEDSMSQSFL